jgi:cytochrome c biogenesis protein CcmG, thiol:disulfide interchange protein DsbE
MSGIAVTQARALATVAGLALLAVLVIGLIELAGSAPRRSPSGRASPTLTLDQVQARLAGSPAPLAALHNQADAILTGGPTALRARLAGLRGYPVVIDKWASWCVPCQQERGALQAASASYGRRVAFLGIDSGDTSPTDASAFARAVPVGYPSYGDPSGHLGAAVTDSAFIPATVFYDRAGRQYIHQGPYPSAAKLEADIRRYALDEG